MAWNFRDLNPSLQKRIALAGLAPKVENAPSKIKGVLNAHEKDFYVSHLLPREQSGELKNIRYEGISLPIGYRCNYNPDFIAETESGETHIWEVKAPHRFKEKGIIKLKSAAQQYPQYQFFLATKKNKEWVIKYQQRHKELPKLTPVDELDE